MDDSHFDMDTLIQEIPLREPCAIVHAVVPEELTTPYVARVITRVRGSAPGRLIITSENV